MLSKQVIAICALLLLTAMFVPWEAFGQESDVTLELLWEKTLDSPIRYRVMNEWILDVGIDTTVSEDENPVRMVTTERSIYIFDKQGKTISQIPLKAKKPGEIADKEKGKIIREQKGTVSPNGQYYAIAEIFIAYEEFKYGEVSVFNQEGDLQFKIKGGGMPYFSPNGKYIVLFYESPYSGDARIQFYDLEGDLRKAIDLPPRIYRIGFSKDGSLVETYRIGQGGLLYDAWGNQVGEKTKAQQKLEREKKKREMTFSFTQKAKKKVWKSKPKGVGELIAEEDKRGVISGKTMTARMGQGVISKNGKFGLISDGNVLSCFRINAKSKSK